MKIFISAASKEFMHCREALAKALREIDHKPIYQDEMTQDPFDPMSKTLEDLINQCDCFIALVGDVYGKEPSGQPRGIRRSYTQWEYFCASGERNDEKRTKKKPTFIYFAEPEFLKEQAESNTDLRECLDSELKSGLSELQQKFKLELRKSGRGRGKFINIDNLLHKVLVDIHKLDGKWHKFALITSFSLALVLGSALWMRPVSNEPPYKPPPPPRFSDLPGGAVLELIYTSNAPAESVGAPKPEIQCDLFEMHEVPPSVNIMLNGESLISGTDNFAIGLHALSAGYLYVFRIGSEGKVKWLFGSASKEYSSITNPIVSGQTIEIPAAKNAVLTPDTNVGMEHYYIVYSQTRWGELEQRLAAAEESAWTRPGKKIPSFEYRNRGVKGIPTTIATVDKILSNKLVTAPIGSSPILATNTDLVIERWYQHDGK